MSRHDRGMSGANNVPLGNRPQGIGTTFGKGPDLAASGIPDGGSLLKPAYLQNASGAPPIHSPPSNKSNSRFGPMSGYGQPPGVNVNDSLGEYGGGSSHSYCQGGYPPPPPGGGPPPISFQQPQTVQPPPQGIKRPNPALIASINAALGHKAGSAPPPIVGGSAVGGIQSSGADPNNPTSGGGPERKRKRKSRWGNAEEDKTCIPGMPTVIPSGLTQVQEEAYLLQLKIEDASRRLRVGDFGIPVNPEDRSPSPEPIYSSDGKRMNTREYRKRKES